MNSTFHYKGFDFMGISEGGIRTSVIISQMDLMFDIGLVYHEKIHISNVFITHGHLDHSSGIPHFISQRSLKKLKPPNIILHESLIEQMDQILKIYSKIEDFPYSYNLIPAKENEIFFLNKNRFVKPLKTFHRIPSLGYTIFDISKKLKKEYINQKPSELIKLKSEGLELSEEKHTPLISFSGDSKIEYILNKDVINSKILFLECTYIDETRDVERARKWGHIHLDEIIHYAKEFNNEKIVLFHFSKRFSNKYILSTVQKKLPDILKDRVHCFLPSDKKYEK